MRKTLRIAAVALFALAGTLAILLNGTDVSQSSCFLFFVRDTLAPLKGQETTAALLLLALAWLHGRYAFAPYAWQRGEKAKLCVLSAAFALVCALGAVYAVDDGVFAGFLSREHLLLLAGKAFGFFTLAFVGMKALLFRLLRLDAKAVFSEPPEKAGARRIFLMAWALLLLAWLPSLIARWPGAVTDDAARALQQFTGQIMPTGDHPQAYTWLLGLVVWLGSQLGGDNFGVFLYTLLQMLLLSGVMALSVAELAREGFPAGARRALLALYALLSAAMLNAAVVVKDVPYSAAFLAFVILSARAFLHPQAVWRAIRWWVAYSLAALGVLLLRHNGVLAVAPMTVVLLVRFLRVLRPKTPFRSALLAAPLAVLLLFNVLVVPRIAYPVESTADVLGVSIQQTARVMKNFPQDLTAEEYAAVDKLLEADKLAAAYTPRQSDSTRKMFRYFNGHTFADKLAFAGLSVRLTVSHPLTSLLAFWSLSGGFLNPFDTSASYYQRMVAASSPKYPQALAITHPAALAPLQDKLLSLESSYRSLPVISQLQASGLYVWAMFAGWYLLRRTREKKLAWLLVAPLATLLSCLLSAGFAIGSRYALPLVYSVPYLLCLFARPVLRESGATVKECDIPCEKK